MYTPDYQRIDDDQYVGVIKEHGKPVLIGNVKLSSSKDAVKHAEEYIKEYYLHEKKNRMSYYQNWFIVCVVLTASVFSKISAIPSATNIGFVLSVASCGILLTASFCFGILWRNTHQGYTELIDSYHMIHSTYL